MCVCVCYDKYTVHVQCVYPPTVLYNPIAQTQSNAFRGLIGTQYRYPNPRRIS